MTTPSMLLSNSIIIVVTLSCVDACVDGEIGARATHGQMAVGILILIVGISHSDLNISDRRSF